MAVTDKTGHLVSAKMLSETDRDSGGGDVPFQIRCQASGKRDRIIEENEITEVKAKEKLRKKELEDWLKTDEGSDWRGTDKTDDSECHTYDNSFKMGYQVKGGEKASYKYYGRNMFNRSQVFKR